MTIASTQISVNTKVILVLFQSTHFCQIYLRAISKLKRYNKKPLYVFIESMAFNRSADLTKKAEVCFSQ